MWTGHGAQQQTIILTSNQPVHPQQIQMMQMTGAVAQPVQQGVVMAVAIPVSK